MHYSLVAPMFLGVLAVANIGCSKRPNPAVCCVSLADCDQLGVDEPFRPCSDGLVCVDNACVPPQCQIDQDCTADSPFCSNGVCLGCRDDNDCASETPICDPVTASCRTCSADVECASEACDFGTGTCLAEEQVLYAAPTGTDQADCSHQQPCTITKAVTAANAARSSVKLLPGVYNASVSIDRAITIHGEAATLVASASGPALTAVDAARVDVYDLSIVNNNTEGSNLALLGVYCASEDNVNTPELSLVRTVVDTQRQPIHINLCKLKMSQGTVRSPRNTTTHYTFVAANGGTASIDRSLITGGSSIAVISADVTITNSVLDSILPAINEAALVANLGSISIAFSTIFETSLECVAGPDPACASAARIGVCIENSIVNKPNSPNDTFMGDKCRCDYCVVSPQQGPVFGSNNLIGVNPNFRNPGEHDLHLLADSPAIDAAHPSIPGTADYDGVSRPQNGRSDLGAFEFKP